jgi:hypothetical protein
MQHDNVLGGQREIGPVWSQLLSTVAKRERVVIVGLAESLTDGLFYLEEPWRGRFLDLVANLATSWAWPGGQPTREEVTAWLGADPNLYQRVWSLLQAWPRPER